MVNVPKSDLCCHESSSSWLCYATLDKTTKFLTKWPSAIIIPFAPFFLNAAVQILRTITKCVCLGLTSESCRTHMTALFPTFKRGLFYLGVVLFRMFALYLFPMKLQDWLLHINSSRAEQNLDCWCRHLVSERKCRNEFDFSDHIVLFTVQYILPLALEAEASLSLMKALLPKQFQLATNVAVVLHFVAFLVSCGVIALNLKAIYFTCVYFHTPLESIVGSNLDWFKLSIDNHLHKLFSEAAGSGGRKSRFSRSITEN
eukprot:gene29128-38190_t